MKRVKDQNIIEIVIKITVSNSSIHFESANFYIRNAPYLPNKNEIPGSSIFKNVTSVSSVFDVKIVRPSR